jgi:hypothetical protein
MIPKVSHRSAPFPLMKRDRRRRESQLLEREYHQLVAQLGGTATPAQQALCERAAMLRVHLAQLDARAFAGGGIPEDELERYGVLTSTLMRVLSRLGLKPAATKPQTALDYLRDLRRAKEAAAS